VVALGGTVTALWWATIWFGATGEGCLAAVELVIYACALCLFLPQRHPAWGPAARSVDAAIFALALLPLIQLIPLPHGLTFLLSPGFARLRHELGLAEKSFIPLAAYPYVTWLALHRLSAAALVYFIFSRGVDTERKLKWMLLSLLWLGSLEAAYGLLGYLLKSPTILAVQPQLYPGSATGTLICKNHFAGLMELCLPAALGYYLAFLRPLAAEQRQGKQFLLLFAALIMALALVFSRSRAGTVCFALALVFFVLLVRQGRGATLGRAAVLAAALAVVSYGAVIGLDPVIERFKSLNKVEAMSRVDIWRDGLRLASFSPLLGSGVGSWASLYPVVKSTTEQLTFSHAHNDYVEALAEGGIVGAGILLALFAGAYREARRTLLDERRSRRARVLAASLFTAVFSIALHGLVDFNLQIPSNLFLLMMVLGLIAALSRQPGLLVPSHKFRREQARAAGEKNRVTPLFEPAG